MFLDPITGKRTIGVHGTLLLDTRILVDWIGRLAVDELATGDTIDDETISL